MDWLSRLACDPEVLGGKPVIRGTRLSAELILQWLAAGESEKSIMENYPGLAHEDILACLSLASHLAHEYRFIPLPASA